MMKEGTLFLQVDFEKLSDFIPKGQMLVDSETFAFIYIVESQNEYSYIQLPEQVWNACKVGMQQNTAVFLTNGSLQLELPNFLEEMLYLIENIKGNANYGGEMVQKIESHFS